MKLKKMLISKHLKHINKKLKNEQIKTVHRLRSLPEKIQYVSWSIGFEGETDYSYKIITHKDEIYYCVIVTFLSLFILQSRFFRESEGEFIPL